MSTNDPKPVPAPATPLNRTSGRSRRGVYRALMMLAAFFVALTVIFPLAFGPGVDLPYPILPGNPTALTVQISNQNLTPLTNIEYTCALDQLDLTSGVHVSDATMVIRGHIMKLDGRKAINAECQTVYPVNAPIKDAAYKLTLNYRVYPWSKDYTKEYRLAAVVDAEGHVTKWVRK